MTNILNRLSAKLENATFLGIPLDTLLMLKLYFALFYMGVASDIQMTLDLLAAWYG